MILSQQNPLMSSVTMAKHNMPLYNAGKYGNKSDA